MTIRIHSAILVCWVCLLPLEADPVDWLYEVQLPVSARTQEVAENAIENAFSVLMIRLTGRPDVMQDSQLSRALGSGQAHVNQFTYTERFDEQGTITDMLVVSFTRESVKQLLRDSKLPLWPEDRPSILLWLTIHDRENSVFVDKKDPSGQKIVERATTRGVELYLPNMDKAEREKLTTSSVIGRFWLDLHEVSKPYEADLVAAVACETTLLNRVRTSLTYWYKEQQFDYVLEIDNLARIEQEVVDHIVDFLVQRQTIYRDHATVHRLLVREVTTVETYASIMKTMNEYDFIDRCEIASYSNGNLYLDVYTPSTEIQLTDLLTDRGDLEPVGEQSLISTDKSSNTFRWIGNP